MNYPQFFISNFYNIQSSINLGLTYFFESFFEIMKKSESQNDQSKIELNKKKIQMTSMTSKS